MFEAGFNNLAGEALSDFDCLRNAATLGNESSNIRACAKKATVAKSFHTYADGYFFNLSEVFLAFQCALLLRGNSIANPAPRL